MSRLESSLPLLAAKIRESDERGQRRVAIAVASWATGVAHLDDVTERRSALALLRRGQIDQILLDELFQFVEQLDEAAWSIHDAVAAGKASRDDYVAAFGRARAAAAVLFACDSNSASAALESTYEASVVVSEVDTLRLVVEDALGVS